MYKNSWYENIAWKDETENENISAVAWCGGSKTFEFSFISLTVAQIIMNLCFVDDWFIEDSEFKFEIIKIWSKLNLWDWQFVAIFGLKDKADVKVVYVKNILQISIFCFQTNFMT